MVILPLVSSLKRVKGKLERYFLIREGKARAINRWPGWLYYFKKKNRMYYICMSDGEGFVQRQQELRNTESANRPSR
ncbi:MAG TPA: hypothetical protein VL098_04020 [Flavipsychrobacter sp.]|nr:hypothetical protein [Flavipsychrobacter sp.]